MLRRLVPPGLREPTFHLLLEALHVLLVNDRKRRKLLRIGLLFQTNSSNLGSHGFQIDLPSFLETGV